MITLIEDKPAIMKNEEYGPDDLLTPQQAVDYLIKKWGLESWSVDAFRQYRHRRGIRTPPAWRLRDLDALPPLDPSKQRQQTIEEESEKTRE